jgi:hypothetical protein
LALGLIGFSLFKLGVFNLTGGGGLNTVYEVVSFSFVMTLCVGGLYFKDRNNKRMVLEYTMLMLLYYALFYLVLFPNLAGISPYLALWSDVIASLPVILYCYGRTWLTVKFVEWVGPHCYIQDKYLNLIGSPCRRLHQNGLLPAAAFNAIEKSLVFFRENGALQQRMARVMMTMKTTNFVLFCCSFASASIIVDAFFAIWGDVYAAVNGIPFDGAIWPYIVEHDHFDFFIVWDGLQQGMAVLFMIAVVGFLIAERRRGE